MSMNSLFERGRPPPLEGRHPGVGSQLGQEFGRRTGRGGVGGDGCVVGLRAHLVLPAGPPLTVRAPGRRRCGHGPDPPTGCAGRGRRPGRAGGAAGPACPRWPRRARDWRTCWRPRRTWRCCPFYPHLLAWELAQLPADKRVMPVILLDAFEDVATARTATWSASSSGWCGCCRTASSSSPAAPACNGPTSPSKASSGRPRAPCAATGSPERCWPSSSSRGLGRAGGRQRSAVTRIQQQLFRSAFPNMGRSKGSVFKCWTGPNRCCSGG